MKQRGLLIVGLVALAWPGMAFADNCGSLSDCYSSLRAGLAAIAGVGTLAALVSLGLDFSPLGPIKGIVEAITGKDMITQKELEWWQRALGVLPVLGAAGVLGAMIKGADELGDFGKFAKYVTNATRGPYAAEVKGLTELFESGKVAKATEIESWAAQSGWQRIKKPTGPIKYFDDAGVERVTIKRGSPRTPGSQDPHISLRNSNDELIDPWGNKVGRESPGNHVPIDYDIER